MKKNHITERHPMAMTKSAPSSEVERVTFNHGVDGSNPSERAI